MATMTYRETTTFHIVAITTQILSVRIGAILFLAIEIPRQQTKFQRKNGWA